METATSAPAPVVTDAPRLTGSGTIQIIHAAPQVAPISVRLEPFVVAADLPFATSTPAEDMHAGDYTVRITDSQGTPLIAEFMLRIENQSSLILVFTGTPDALTVTTYSDSADPLPADTSRITLVHAVPRGPDFALYHSESAVTDTVTFGQETSALVPSGESTLSLRGGTVTLLEQPFELEPLTQYRLFVVGRGDDPSTWTILPVARPTAGQAHIRLINMISDQPVVTVRAGESILDVDYGRMSDRFVVSAGNTTLDLRSSMDAEPFATLPLDLDSGPSYTVLLLGTALTSTLLVYPEDQTPLPPDTARVLLFNTAPAVLQVQVALKGFGSPLGTVGFGAQPLSVELASSETYGFEWNELAGDISRREDAEGLQFEAGRVYYYLFAARGTQPPIILSDLVGTANATTEPALLSQVRVVNTLPFPATIRANDTLLVDDLDAGTASGYNPVEADLVTFSAEVSGTTRIEVSEELNPDWHYSLYLFGDRSQNMLLVRDEFGALPGTASVRLVNLSSTMLGLEYTDYATEPPAAATEDALGEGFMLPIDVRSAVSSPPGAAYGVMLPGEHNVYITDESRSGLLQVYGVEFLADTRYDVIVTIEDRVRILILPVTE